MPQRGAMLLRRTTWATPEQRQRLGAARGSTYRTRLVVALDLGAMHDAARTGVEGITPVHGAAVVPHQHITDAPLVREAVFQPRGLNPLSGPPLR